MDPCPHGRILYSHLVGYGIAWSLVLTGVRALVGMNEALGSIPSIMEIGGEEGESRHGMGYCQMQFMAWPGNMIIITHC